MRISDWSSDVCSSDLRSCCRDGRKARPAFPLSAIAADVAQVPARLLVGRKSFLAGERQRQAAAEPVARSGAGSQERHEDRCRLRPVAIRSEEHTSELQSLMRISYAVFCLKTKNNERQTI